MANKPLEVFERLDPEFLAIVEKTRALALNDGALPRKIKLLIALAIDASHGAVEGVISLTRLATLAGATKEEIAEALRVAQYISGAGATYSIAAALKDVF
jgi:alkylhydroperoxidase/carboxymuconolactone decarboxylase family protein YurZ